MLEEPMRPTMLPGPSQDSCCIESLPVEILTIILKILLPRLGHSQEFNRWGIYNNKSVRHIFDQGLKVFARLRLVCNRWSLVVAPLVFSQATLATAPDTSLDEILDFFSARAEYLHSLTIFGVPSDGLEHPSIRALAEAVGRGLNMCTQLEKLELLGNYPAFINRQWLPKFAPRLPLTVKTLLIEAEREIDICYVLLGLGSSLESLEIVNWEPRIPLKSFHMPKLLPKLKHVTLRNCHHSSANVLRFFNRLAGPKAANNPLRILHLSGDIHHSSDSDIMPILSIDHIAAQLTHLRLTFDNLTFQPGPMIEGFRRCINLEELSFGFHAPHKDILNNLPKRLRSLELSTLSRPRVVKIKDVIRFLEARQYPQLRHVKVLISQTDLSTFESLISPISGIQWEDELSSSGDFVTISITILTR